MISTATPRGRLVAGQLGAEMGRVGRKVTPGPVRGATTVRA